MKAMTVLDDKIASNVPREQGSPPRDEEEGVYSGKGCKGQCSYSCTRSHLLISSIALCILIGAAATLPIILSKDSVYPSSPTNASEYREFQVSMGTSRRGRSLAIVRCDDKRTPAFKSQVIKASKTAQFSNEPIMGSVDWLRCDNGFHTFLTQIVNPIPTDQFEQILASELRDSGVNFGGLDVGEILHKIEPQIIPRAKCTSLSLYQCPLGSFLQEENLCLSDPCFRGDFEGEDSSCCSVILTVEDDSGGEIVEDEVIILPQISQSPKKVTNLSPTKMPAATSKIVPMPTATSTIVPMPTTTSTIVPMPTATAQESKNKVVQKLKLKPIQRVVEPFNVFGVKHSPKRSIISNQNQKNSILENKRKPSQTMNENKHDGTIHTDSIVATKRRRKSENSITTVSKPLTATHVSDAAPVSKSSQRFRGARKDDQRSQEKQRSKAMNQARQHKISSTRPRDELSAWRSYKYGEEGSEGMDIEMGFSRQGGDDDEDTEDYDDDEGMGDYYGFAFDDDDDEQHVEDYGDESESFDGDYYRARNDSEDEDSKEYDGYFRSRNDSEDEDSKEVDGWNQSLLQLGIAYDQHKRPGDHTLGQNDDMSNGNGYYDGKGMHFLPNLQDEDETGMSSHGNQNEYSAFPRDEDEIGLSGYGDQNDSDEWDNLFEPRDEASVEKALRGRPIENQVSDMEAEKIFAELDEIVELPTLEDDEEEEEERSNPTKSIPTSSADIEEIQELPTLEEEEEEEEERSITPTKLTKSTSSGTRTQTKPEVGVDHSTDYSKNKSNGKGKSGGKYNKKTQKKGKHFDRQNDKKNTRQRQRDRDRKHSEMYEPFEVRQPTQEDIEIAKEVAHVEPTLEEEEEVEPTLEEEEEVEPTLEEDEEEVVRSTKRTKSTPTRSTKRTKSTPTLSSKRKQKKPEVGVDHQLDHSTDYTKNKPNGKGKSREYHGKAGKKFDRRSDKTKSIQRQRARARDRKHSQNYAVYNDFEENSSETNPESNSPFHEVYKAFAQNDADAKIEDEKLDATFKKQIQDLEELERSVESEEQRINEAVTSFIVTAKDAVESNAKSSDREIPTLEMAKSRVATATKAVEANALSTAKESAALEMALGEMRTNSVESATTVKSRKLRYPPLCKNISRKRRYGVKPDAAERERRLSSCYREVLGANIFVVDREYRVRYSPLTPLTIEDCQSPDILSEKRDNLLKILTSRKVEVVRRWRKMVQDAYAYFEDKAKQV